MCGEHQGVPDGSVLRHEIGHLLGLGHVDDPEQVMHPDANAVAAAAENQDE
jgi:predicted Zn-dependent protease